jgi:hypothetical protein
MLLPKQCPNCHKKLHFGSRNTGDTRAFYETVGIQRCGGTLTDYDGNLREEEWIVEIDMEFSGNESTVEAYEIVCSHCGYLLWRKSIIINEEKFFENI